MGATRSSTAGSLTSSDFVGFAQGNSWGGGIIAYATAVADQTGFTSGADITNIGSLTITPNTSRMLKVSYDMTVTSDTAGDICGVSILKNGTLVKLGQHPFSSSGGTICQATSWYLDVSPTASATTYKLQLGRTASSGGTFALRATNSRIAQLIIEDIGPAF